MGISKHSVSLESGALPRLELVSVLLQGDRDEQQDAIVWMPLGDQLLLALADGMGGHAEGAAASTGVIAAVVDFLEGSETGDRSGCQLGGAVSLADCLDAGCLALRELRQRWPELKDKPDTTLVLALVDEKGVQVAHLGDSRCYRLNARGDIAHTRDHSLVQSLVDSGELECIDAGAPVCRNVLTRSVSSGAEMAEHTEYPPLKQGDALLLCSDGFWEHVNPSELRRLPESQDVEALLDEYSSRCIQRGDGHADNISALFLRLPL